MNIKTKVIKCAMSAYNHIEKYVYNVMWKEGIMIIRIGVIKDVTNVLSNLGKYVNVVRLKEGIMNIE